MNTRIH